MACLLSTSRNRWRFSPPPISFFTPEEQRDTFQSHSTISDKIVCKFLSANSPVFKRYFKVSECECWADGTVRVKRFIVDVQLCDLITLVFRVECLRLVIPLFPTRTDAGSWLCCLSLFVVFTSLRKKMLPRQVGSDPELRQLFLEVWQFCWNVFDMMKESDLTCAALIFFPFFFLPSHVGFRLHKYLLLMLLPLQ